jgi:hypothetical protein
MKTFVLVCLTLSYDVSACNSITFNVSHLSVFIVTGKHVSVCRTAHLLVCTTLATICRTSLLDFNWIVAGSVDQIAIDVGRVSSVSTLATCIEFRLLFLDFNWIVLGDVDEIAIDMGWVSCTIDFTPKDWSILGTLYCFIVPCSFKNLVVWILSVNHLVWTIL